MTRNISMTESRSSVEGGCNGCTDHVGPGHDYRVWLVHLRTQSFRLCDCCMVALKPVIAPGFAAASRAMKSAAEK